MDFFDLFATFIECLVIITFSDYISDHNIFPNLCRAQLLLPYSSYWEY